MKRLAVLLALILLAAPTALAAPPPAQAETSVLVVPNDLRDLAMQAGERLAPPETPHFDLPAITVPLVHNGRLAGYSFLSVRLHLADEASIPEIRRQLHFVMHDLVGLAYAHPFTLVSRDDFSTGDTYEHWDRALDARLGAGVVSELEPLAAGIQLQRRYR
ncbi:hypothetical protein X907_1660 [Glycocaulis alkaliphilus]|uniref:Uncharacterized protein n=1 Tax=Glycocaulis alkaliphilus TaxID=1434191 RepID=A0A3T0E9X2_9PROT|nr:hypothetical protein [Glycocaulis alkaliphilus]AZU04191.1 hypothetical protein X907_1660 [Glycocaulis alkaliphilus]GGB76534.1 hypothetical protein GCM10007417_15460 [Glycocaulis alkaliphilus]